MPHQIIHPFRRSQSCHIRLSIHSEGHNHATSDYPSIQKVTIMPHQIIHPFRRSQSCHIRLSIHWEAHNHATSVYPSIQKVTIMPHQIIHPLRSSQPCHISLSIRLEAYNQAKSDYPFSQKLTIVPHNSVRPSEAHCHATWTRPSNKKFHKYELIVHTVDGVLLPTTYMNLPSIRLVARNTLY